MSTIQSAQPAPVYLSQRHIEKLRLVANIIGSDLTQHHTIEELSSIVGLNQFALKKGFKLMFHSGLFEYLQHKRLELGKSLLVKGDEDVADIARQCGYNHSTNFTATFKKYCQLSPSAYRRKHRNLLPADTLLHTATIVEIGANLSLCQGEL